MKFTAFLLKLFIAIVIFSGNVYGAVKCTVLIEGQVEMPATVNGIPWVRVTDYGVAENAPEQGVGVSYHGEKMHVDVYVYDCLKAEWKGQSLFERIRKEHEGIDGMFKEMAKMGRFTNYKMVKSDKVDAGGRTFFHTLLEFKERSQNMELYSDYYISEWNGKILKIRISADKYAPRKNTETALEELASVFKKREETVTSK